ncbi:MAG: hypothetical protein FPO08_01110 [Geobacter sp.]|nr:MAG: hypothetical protein FPO08_01110 [Geobacter sp.]
MILVQSVLFILPMVPEYNIKEHCQIVGVDDENAYMRVTIPLHLLDKIPMLLDHLAYVANFIRIRTRISVSSQIDSAIRADRAVRNSGLSHSKNQVKKAP